MNLTQKEIDFLDDFKTQEKLCIEKYDRYSACACSTELKSLFGELADRERGHLKTINEMSGGTGCRCAADSKGEQLQLRLCRLLRREQPEERQLSLQ